MTTQSAEGETARPAAKKPSVRERLRTVLLSLFVVVLTVFCIQNLETARVWPIGQAPLFVVIVGCVVLGGAVGWIARSIAGGRRKDGG